MSAGPGSIGKDDAREVNDSARASVGAYGALLIVGALVVLVYVKIASQIIFPFNVDSAVYIGLARNLLNGNGYVHTSFSYDKELAPHDAFPPGFPILIAGVSSLGMDGSEAALWVARISWVLVPAATAWCLAPLMGWGVAALCGILTLISPGAVLWGYPAMSDIPFFVLVLVSLGCLFRSMAVGTERTYLALSGFLAGVGYSLRTVGIAVFAAVVVGFAMAVIARLMSAGEAGKRLAFWFAGGAPVVAALWAWNVAVFGTIQPYGTAPTSISLHALIHNARDFAWNMILDLTGSPTIAQLVWDYRLALWTGIPVAALILPGLWRRWHDGGRSERYALLVLGLYCAAGSSVVIIAKTRYGVIDHLRYTLQYTWIVLAMICLAFIRKGSKNILRRWAVTAMVAMSFLVGHSAFAIEHLSREAAIKEVFNRNENVARVVDDLPDRRWTVTNQLAIRITEDEHIKKAIQELPQEALIVCSSSYGGLLTLTTGRRLRDSEIEDFEDMGVYIRLREDAKKVAAMRPYYFLLLPTNATLKRQSYAWKATFKANMGPQFAVVRETTDMLLVGYDRESGRI